MYKLFYFLIINTPNYFFIKIKKKTPYYLYFVQFYYKVRVKTGKRVLCLLMIKINNSSAGYRNIYTVKCMNPITCH